MLDTLAPIYKICFLKSMLKFWETVLLPEVDLTVGRIQPFSIAGGMEVCETILLINLHSEFLKLDLAGLKSKLWTR